VDMHTTDFVGINGITRVLLLYTCQQGVYPRGHVLPLQIPLCTILVKYRLYLYYVQYIAFNWCNEACLTYSRMFLLTHNTDMTNHQILCLGRLVITQVPHISWREGNIWKLINRPVAAFTSLYRLHKSHSAKSAQF
jgi:hypothetical protein